MICGETFTAAKSHMVACSDPCRQARRNQQKRQRTGLEGSEYICDVCGKTFSPVRRQQRRCSIECRRKHDSDRTNAYNKAHAAERKAYMAQYERRPDSRRRKAERESKYRKTDTYKARQSAYQASDKCKAAHRRSQSKRRAAIKGAPAQGSIPTILDLMRAQGGMCAYCKTRRGPFHVDHIRPLAKGGQHTADNLQALCQPCNQRKLAMHPLDFARISGRLF